MSSPCHIWAGPGVNEDGYARRWINGRNVRLHRYFYEQAKGKIPKGLVLHHECGNKLCLNPDHLRPVTRAEHALLHDQATKMHDGKRHLAATKTHCPRGHALTYENTELRTSGGYTYRRCRECRRRESREQVQRERERNAAA